MPNLAEGMDLEYTCTRFLKRMSNLCIPKNILTTNVTIVQ